MGDKVNDKAWDIGFHREMGDESNPTWAIVVGGTSKALHIVDAVIAGTDYNVSAGTNTALFIHGDTTPVTKYGKFFTDETDFFFQPVGVNGVVNVPSSKDFTVQVNSVDEYVFDATNFNIGTNAILGTNLKINAGGTAIQFSNAASWQANGTGTVAAIGPLFPGASATCNYWIKVLNVAGSLGYIPVYGL